LHEGWTEGGTFWDGLDATRLYVRDVDLWRLFRGLVILKDVMGAAFEGGGVAEKVGDGSLICWECLGRFVFVFFGLFELGIWAGVG